MFPIILAQKVLVEPGWEVSSLEESYWEMLQGGGPVMLGLHVLMAVACVAAVVLARREGRSTAPYFVALLPFALGAVALWVQVMDVAVLSGVGWGGFSAITIRFHTLPRPFYLGTALSVALLVLVALLRKARRDSK